MAVLSVPKKNIEEEKDAADTAGARAAVDYLRYCSVRGAREESCPTTRVEFLVDVIMSSHYYDTGCAELIKIMTGSKMDKKNSVYCRLQECIVMITYEGSWQELPSYMPALCRIWEASVQSLELDLSMPMTIDFSMLLLNSLLNICEKFGETFDEELHCKVYEQMGILGNMVRSALEHTKQHFLIIGRLPPTGYFDPVVHTIGNLFT